MRTLLVVVAVSLSGCLSEGGECTAGAACATTTDSLWCEGGKLVKYRCLGELGCSEMNGQVQCDFRGSAEGTPCPIQAKGIGYCATSTRFLKCTDSKWKGQDCSSCTTNNLTAICNP